MNEQENTSHDLDTDKYLKSPTPNIACADSNLINVFRRLLMGKLINYRAWKIYFPDLPEVVRNNNSGTNVTTNLPYLCMGYSGDFVYCERRKYKRYPQQLVWWFKTNNFAKYALLLSVAIAEEAMGVPCDTPQKP